MRILAGELTEEMGDEKERAALAWARDAAARGAMLLHLRLGVLGRATAAHASGEYVGPNGRPVTAPVIEFEGGGTNVADPKAFAELTLEARAFALKVSEKLAEAIRWGVIFAHNVRLDEDATMKILGALLQSQVVRLQASDVPEEVAAAMFPERSGSPPPEGRQTGPERGGAPTAAPTPEDAPTGQGGAPIAPSEADWPEGFRKGEPK